MKLLVFYLLSILFAGANLSAQPVRGVNALFRVGYGYSPSLRQVEDDVPFPETIRFSKHSMLLGLEGNFRLERAIIGIEGTAAIATESSGFEYSEPFMFSGHFNFGYIISENLKRWLYPSIGTGPAFIVFSSYKMENGEYYRAKEYNLLSPSIDLGLNADFVFPRLSGEVQNYDRFMVGIRCGYIYSFTKSHWRDEHWNQVPEMNVYRNNSFYLTAVVGIAGFSRDTRRIE